MLKAMNANCTLVLCLLAASLLAGRAAAQDHPPYALSKHPSRDGRCRGDTGAADLDRSEKACLAQLTGIASRQGNALRLKLQNGKSRVTLPNTDYFSCRLATMKASNGCWFGSTTAMRRKLSFRRTIRLTKSGLPRTVGAKARPEFAWEHVWQVGDLVLWDNRCTMHRRDPFDAASRRIMHRTQIKGTTAPV